MKNLIIISIPLISTHICRNNVTHGVWNVTFYNPTSQAHAGEEMQIYISSLPIKQVLRVFGQFSFVKSGESELIKIEAKLEKGGNPIVGAAVVAEVISSENNGKDMTMKLMDDGFGCDVEKNDGIYTRYLSTLTLKQNVRYQVVIKAASVSSTTKIRPVGTMSFVSMDMQNDWDDMFQFERQYSIDSIK